MLAVFFSILTIYCCLASIHNLLSGWDIIGRAWIMGVVWFGLLTWAAHFYGM